MKKYFLIIAVMALALTACQSVQYKEPANAALNSVENLKVDLDVRNITFTWDEPEGVEEVYIYRNGKLVETVPAGVKTYFVFREVANTDVLYTFKVRKGELVSDGITRTIHIEYDGNAGVAFVQLGGATAQEQKAKAWFEVNYVSKELGQVVDTEVLKGITADGTSTINLDRYSTLWIAVEGRSDMPAEMDDAVIQGIRRFVAAGGKLYLTADAYRLLVPMLRLPEDKMPEAVDNTAVEGTGDWGLNCFMHKRLDYRENAFFAGLVDADGKVMLQNSPNRSNNNHLWNIGGASAMNSWNNAAYGYIYATVAGDNSAQYGALAYLEKFGCSDGVILTGTVVVNFLPAYQWVEGNDYQHNLERLTQNILEEIRIVK